MPVFPRGKSWIASVGSGKDRYRKPFPTEELAKQAELAELIRRKHSGIVQGLTFSTPQPVQKKSSGATMRDLLKLAKRERWVGKKGESQAENAQRVLDIIGDHLPVEDVDRDCLDELLDQLYETGNTGSTINRKLSALSVLLRIAEERQYIERAPRMPRQPESEHRIRYYDNAEEQRMLAICKKFGMADLADFIVLGIDTGFRKMELLNLRIDDCNNGRATLHAGTTKSGKARSVPLTIRAKAIIAARKLRGNIKVFDDLSVAQLRIRWDSLRTAMGMRDDRQFLVHTLRHTCASRLAIAGREAPFIMAWMGHSTITVTQRYMHLSHKALADGASALDEYRMNFDQEDQEPKAA